MNITCKYSRNGKEKADYACYECSDPICSICGYIVEEKRYCNECYGVDAIHVGDYEDNL